MLELKSVRSGYGRIQILRDVSLQVEPGQIVTLLGPNGVGKTTLLRTTCGDLTPTAGQIWFEGREITGLHAFDVISLGIAHIPERRQVFGDMSVLDNLLLGAYHRLRAGQRAQVERDLDRILAMFPVLEEKRRRQARTLSGGQQQMLAIGRGLMSKPRLLLLDEPSLGLAPLMVAEVMQTIRTLRDEGLTVLLVEQNARTALSVADYAYMLETGAVVAEGPAEQFAGGNLVNAYLGSQAGGAV